MSIHDAIHLAQSYYHPCEQCAAYAAALADTQENVERVARAIYSNDTLWDRLSVNSKGVFYVQARTVLRALRGEP